MENFGSLTTNRVVTIRDKSKEFLAKMVEGQTSSKRRKEGLEKKGGGGGRELHSRVREVFNSGG